VGITGRWVLHGIVFNVTVNGLPPFIGATHFQEVAFVFNNLNGDGYSTNPFDGTGTYSEKAKALAKTISSSWISFFANLNPNGRHNMGLSNGQKWPVYAASSEAPDGDGIVFSLNENSIEVDDWRSGGMDWMNEHGLTVFGN
ncbi:hypothetical protein CEP52_016633, partial [Fusarium oligoseptatum]